MGTPDVLELGTSGVETNLLWVCMNGEPPGRVLHFDLPQTGRQKMIKLFYKKLIDKNPF